MNVYSVLLDLTRPKEWVERGPAIQELGISRSNLRSKFYICFFFQHTGLTEYENSFSVTRTQHIWNHISNLKKGGGESQKCYFSSNESSWGQMSVILPFQVFQWIKLFVVVCLFVLSLWRISSEITIGRNLRSHPLVLETKEGFVGSW
jgi:hypothetical protein